jgi:hypothetical protein
MKEKKTLETSQLFSLVEISSMSLHLDPTVILEGMLLLEKKTDMLEIDEAELEEIVNEINWPKWLPKLPKVKINWGTDVTGYPSMPPSPDWPGLGVKIKPPEPPESPQAKRKRKQAELDKRSQEIQKQKEAERAARKAKKRKEMGIEEPEEELEEVSAAGAGGGAVEGGAGKKIKRNSMIRTN